MANHFLALKNRKNTVFNNVLLLGFYYECAVSAFLNANCSRMV
jgi:hypothetical protein